MLKLQYSVIEKYQNAHSVANILWCFQLSLQQVLSFFFDHQATTATTAIMAAVIFDRERHMKYFAHHLVQLPYPYSSLDTNRLTLVHFAVHALDMLKVWDDETLLTKLSLNKQSIIDWIYNLLVTEPIEHAGFKGGTFLGGSFIGGNSSSSGGGGGDVSGDYDDGVEVTVAPPREYNHGHIAMTYTALCTLTMLGDDLSRLDKDIILRAMKTLQRDDGSFKCVAVGSEQDTRFLFCACAISHMLNDWSAVDKDRAVEFVRNCRSFDGAIALIPGQARNEKELCKITCVLYS